MTPNFWMNKRVLITGHSGFKGCWLTLWLSHLGAKVTGLSLEPNTQPSLFESASIGSICESSFADIRDPQVCFDVVEKCQPEIVIHLAAQALVRESYKEPLATYATNVMGTANILEAIRQQDSVKVALIITTDKVYANKEWCWSYRESDALGGHDPYSASKAACEIVIQSYRDAFLADKGVAVASARAGNVIGGGDWSLDRLIPDAIRSWQAQKRLNVRHPLAVRPWQHVLEPISSYLVLAEKLWSSPELAGSYNFGPETQDAATVRDIIHQAMQTYPNAEVKFGDNEGPHEAGLLNLDVSLAKTQLGIYPRWSLSQAVSNTMNWYHRFDNGEDARQLCLKDIQNFEGSL